MIPYSCPSYKAVLREGLQAKRAGPAGARFTFQAMAEHCGIQKTYLSKVLNHDVHLSEDQLYLALDYLGFSEEEREFTLLLHSLERTDLERRRAQLQKKIASIRATKLKTESSLDLDSTQAQLTDLAEYYLDPLFQVVHMCLTLKRFRDDPELLAETLHLKSRSLRGYLKGLERMGLIKLQESEGRITKAHVLKDNLHLPQDSVLHGAYSMRMRLKALERMDQLDASEAYRFSVVFSTSPKVREKIHASFLDWLRGVQKLVQSGKEEEVYQMNFDLLNWT